jgi:hypothetical protein
MDRHIDRWMQLDATVYIPSVMGILNGQSIPFRTIAVNVAIRATRAIRALIVTPENNAYFLADDFGRMEPVQLLSTFFPEVQLRSWLSDLLGSCLQLFTVYVSMVHPLSY